MAGIQWKQPDAFSFNAEDWPSWKIVFESFRQCSKLYKEPDSDQIQTLIYCMGAVEASKICSMFKYEGTFKKNVVKDGETEIKDIQQSNTDYDCVMMKFSEYFVPTILTRYERARFNERNQAEGEPFEHFLRDVYSLAKKCQYGESEDEMILDRIVQGLHHKPTREKLELMPALTTKEAISIARRQEIIMNQNSIKIPETSSSNIDEVKQGKRTKYGPSRFMSAWNDKQLNKQLQDVQPKVSSDRRKCSRCGYIHKYENMKCPAVGKSCMACGGQNHFKSVCKNKSMRHDEVNIHTKKWIMGDGYDGNDTVDQYYIDTVDKSTKNGWFVTLVICNTQVKFKVDTGADITVLSHSVFNQLKNKPKLRKTSVVLTSPGGNIETVGEFITTMTHKGNTLNARVVVIKSSAKALLSRNVACMLGIVKFIDTVDTKIGLMKTKPVKIVLKDDAVPVCSTTSRRIPFPLREAVKKELNRMQENDVIFPVKEPTDWCSNIVVVPKGSKDVVRICVDLKSLNKAVKRPVYTLPTFEEVAPRLAGSRVFSTLDAASGFWQIPLDEESQLLTTFITPHGRYAFKRLPFGINIATDEYQQRMVEEFCKMDGIEVMVDDILVHGSTMEEHDKRLNIVMEKVAKLGLRLNDSKCVYRKSEVCYFGHIISGEGIKPNPDKVRAIAELEPPKNVSELRTVLGMLNYVAKFIPNMSAELKPITNLLRRDTCWQWEHAQEAAFQRVKDLICETTTLTFYDPKLPTVVSADSSSFGIGAVIMQKHNDILKPVAFSSRTLTPSEQRYAMVEKECLALVWACEKFSQYLTGLDQFTLLTDHKPLVPIIGSKSLDEVPIRCQRLVLRLMRFNPVIKYVPGKEQYIADALSRKPLMHSSNDKHMAEIINVDVDYVQANWPASNEKKCQISNASERCPILEKVRNYILVGWPKYKSSVSDDIKPYFDQRGNLSIIDGIITHGDRMVIPHSMKIEILNRLHESHQGVTKCIQNANEVMWWPGMSTDIKNMIDKCLICRENRPANRKEPLKPSELPERPWQVIAMDLFDWRGRSYLVVVDTYSRWMEIKECYRITSRSVIGKLKSIFSTHGIPETVKSDSGTQFVSIDFQRFAKHYGFELITSSPHHHQANGAAENSVNIAKAILRQNDPDIALLNYRNTEHSATGVSPSQALMGRRLKTRLPVMKSKLIQENGNDEAIRLQDEHVKSQYKVNYDRRHGARDLPKLALGQPVLSRIEGESKWANPGNIVATDEENRTYLVKTKTGIIRRNRRHLQPVPSMPPEQPDIDIDVHDHMETTMDSEPTQQLNETPPAQAPQPPRRSARIRKPVVRYSDEHF